MKKPKKMPTKKPMGGSGGAKASNTMAGSKKPTMTPPMRKTPTQAAGPMIAMGDKKPTPAHETPGQHPHQNLGAFLHAKKKRGGKGKA